MSEPRDPHEDPEEEGHSREGLELARMIARSLATAGERRSSGRDGREGRDADPSRTFRRRRGPGRADARLSGAHPDDRDPQGLGSSVERLVGERGWSVDLRVHGLFGRWPELVGPEVAEHCRPQSFDDGRLVVRADSTAWATQLHLLSRDVLRRLNAELGDGTVTFLEVRGPDAGPRSRGAWRVRGRGPRDTYG